jgi:sterol desaturase/sphingolipid hydroxylase (fatty acid hydroxylase superfamily)
MSPLLLRGLVAGALLLLLIGLEARFPRRKLLYARMVRWPSNLGLVALDQALVWLLLPLAPIAWAAAWKGGLLSMFELPGEDLLAVLALDLAIWAQHAAFHRVPWLWRLHRVHHADPDYDVTTALRFHPIEIGLSIGVKLAVITLLGPSPTAVLLFEVLLNGMAMFNHANLALPGWLDAGLRLVLVTPDVHRVHHSVLDREKHNNFGFNLSIWDRLFGTWVEQPAGGHEAMTLGDCALRDPAELSLSAMLTQPFRDGHPDDRCADLRQPAPAR